MTKAPDKIWAVFEPHPNPKDKVPYVYASASQTKGNPYLLSTPPREHADELVELMEKHARWADGIRGAVETNQVADKDVRGLAIAMRDEIHTLLSQIKESDQ